MQREGLFPLQANRLKQVNWILLACAAACLVYYDMVGGLWLKGVTSSWFVLLGGLNLWAVRKLEWKRLRIFVLMEAGLFCGMCADVLLGIHFYMGVGVFALGHILYLAAFCALEMFRPQDLKSIVPAAILSIFFVTATPWISVEDPLLQKLIPGYALIISMMLGKAIANLIHDPSRFRWLLAIGSVLFWFSDLILAVDMFGQSSRLTWILCSYSYWPAQNILAHAIFYAGEVQTNP